MRKERKNEKILSTSICHVYFCGIPFSDFFNRKKTVCKKQEKTTITISKKDEQKYTRTTAKNIKKININSNNNGNNNSNINNDIKIYALNKIQTKMHKNVSVFVYEGCSFE